MNKRFWLMGILWLSLDPIGLRAVGGAEAIERGAGPFAIPTFHCLGVYWSPPGGAPGKDVQVRYRRQGGARWNDALPMRFYPIPGTDLDLTDYRGSIVYLSPATTYEVELTLAGTPTTAPRPPRRGARCFPSGRQPGWVTATRHWKSPSRARPGPIGSTTAGARRSTYGTRMTLASRSRPRT